MAMVTTPTSAAGPPPSSTAATTTPTKQPDSLTFAEPVSTEVRSLITVNVAITASGHGLHCAEPAVSATIPAAIGVRSPCKIATPRRVGRSPCLLERAVAWLFIPYGAGREVVSVRRRDRTLVEGAPGTSQDMGLCSPRSAVEEGAWDTGTGRQSRGRHARPLPSSS